MTDVQPFDPTDILVADHQSPGLEKIEPDFKSYETPPPVLDNDTSSESEESEGDGGSRPKRRRWERRRKGCQSEYGVISQLDPTSNHAAKHALKYGLESRTPSEVDEEEERLAYINGDPMVTDHTRLGSTTNGTSTGQDKRGSAIEIDDDFDPLDMLADGHDNVKLTNGIHKHDETEDGDVDSTSPAPVKKKYDYKPPPLRPVMNGDSRTNSSEDETTATSPSLIKFKIGAANATEPGNTLPAMQSSPGRPSSSGFAEQKTKLPSLTIALSIDSIGTPFSSHSPNLSRPSPAHIQYGPSPGAYSHSSPHSGMSPPAIPSHPALYRTNTRDGSISTPSDYAITSATGSISTPGSSVTNQSPAAYPTPTTATSETSQPHFHLNGTSHTIHSPQLTHSTSPNEASAQTNGHHDDTAAAAGVEDQNGAPGSYKCNIPNCTALPFQTQYLLNSHMNVHSDTRPHFCNVKGCPRGPGGQGFKRKNEMIRHGLVHTSPGYTCPFCPDQQHRYPRPDNLQRHVRVHHMDKDRDDPELREVLAQRPEGGSRGRRRRLGS